MSSKCPLIREKKKMIRELSFSHITEFSIHTRDAYFKYIEIVRHPWVNRLSRGWAECPLFRETKYVSCCKNWSVWLFRRHLHIHGVSTWSRSMKSWPKKSWNMYVRSSLSIYFYQTAEVMGGTLCLMLACGSLPQPQMLAPLRLLCTESSAVTLSGTESLVS